MSFGVNSSDFASQLQNPLTGRASSLDCFGKGDFRAFEVTGIVERIAETHQMLEPAGVPVGQKLRCPREQGDRSRDVATLVSAMSRTPEQFCGA